MLSSAADGDEAADEPLFVIVLSSKGVSYVKSKRKRNQGRRRKKRGRDAPQRKLSCSRRIDSIDWEY